MGRTTSDRSEAGALTRRLRIKAHALAANRPKRAPWPRDYATDKRMVGDDDRHFGTWQPVRQSAHLAYRRGDAKKVLGRHATDSHDDPGLDTAYLPHQIIAATGRFFRFGVPVFWAACI